MLAFCSNDYLGLANHPRVIAAFKRGVDTFGVGSGAAHLVTGHSTAHSALEEELADFTGRPRALLFSTGYMANLGVISALAGRGDQVFQDRLNHASLLDGALLSRARLRRYAHSDPQALFRMLERLRPEGGRARLIATDGVFSMDGDLAPLPALAAVAREVGAGLLVDDAHGLGVLGEEGRGCLAHFDLGSDSVPILMGTLGKAFGTSGAFVGGSAELIETLIQRARSYVYTTAPPPGHRRGDEGEPAHRPARVLAQGAAAGAHPTLPRRGGGAGTAAHGLADTHTASRRGHGGAGPVLEPGSGKTRHPGKRHPTTHGAGRFGTPADHLFRRA